MCTGRIKRTKPCAYGTEFQRLAKLVPADVRLPNTLVSQLGLNVVLQEVKNIKITMAAPEWFHLRHGRYAYPSDVYKNDGMRISALEMLGPLH